MPPLWRVKFSRSLTAFIQLFTDLCLALTNHKQTIDNVSMISAICCSGYRIIKSLGRNMRQTWPDMYSIR